MALYDSVVTPAAETPFSGAAEPVPGASWTRHFDTGPLLLIGHLILHNATAGVTNFTLDLFIDGNWQSSFELRSYIQPLTLFSLTFADLFPIRAGLRKVNFMMTGTVNPLFHLQANKSRLSIIQLPHWDITPLP